MKERNKEATRPGVGGRVEMTGATDADGILVELSGFDIERLTRPEIDAYRERRQAQIDGREAQRIEADAERQFTEAFVSNGGRERDAAAAYKAHRNQQAAEAATKAEASVLADARRRIRQAL